VQQNIPIDHAVKIAMDHHRAGRLAEAEQIYRKVLEVIPEHPVAMHYLGLIAHQIGRNDDAIRLMTRSIELLPSAPYYNNLGAACRIAEKFDLATDALRKAIELDPKAHEQHNNLGLVFLDQRKFEQSEAEFRASLALKPDAPETHNNLGSALLRLGRLEEAERSLRRTLELDPRFAPALVNLTNTLAAMNRLDEAAASAEAALRLAPNDPQAHLVLAHVRLIQGDFVRGWPEYEWRTRRFPFLVKSFAQPRWTGQSLDGKAILLYGEQGFGDTIQFLRFTKVLADRGAKVIVAAAPEMIDLIATAPGVAQTMRYGDLLPNFDLHCPLPSVPANLRTTLETIPRDVPYVHADAARVNAWQQRLAGDGARLRVGLAWAGNPAHEKDHERSCRLDDFAPLAEIPGVVFYSLQKGDGAAQISSAPAGLRLIDVAPELNDFADSAALIMNLDLVIAVDTAPAHLAGALGRPVWTLLHYNGEWRWLLDRSDSPWYPTMRLFRQKRWGEWAGVMERIAAALDAMNTPSTR
jgi:tetratricopeptide (TPR) repeat protein